MEVRRLSCDETEALLPEYILGALEDGDAMSVAWHLRVCQQHAASRDGYETAVVGLAATAAAVEPPARLRARLLASVADRPGAARRVWLGWAVAAVTIVLALAAGVWSLTLQGRLDRMATIRDELMAVASRADAHMVTLETTEAGGSAKGVLIYTGDRAAIWAVGLPPLEGDQVYACWWIDAESRRVLSGTFRPESSVSTWVISMPEDAENYRRIGITLEPHGQITKPEGPRVLGGEF